MSLKEKFITAMIDSLGPSGIEYFASAEGLKLESNSMTRPMASSSMSSSKRSEKPTPIYGYTDKKGSKMERRFIMPFIGRTNDLRRDVDTLLVARLSGQPER